VTRLTLRTHSLPEFFGAVFTTIKATSKGAFRRLIGKVIEFYEESLFNPNWGKQISFRPGEILADHNGVPRARPAAGGGNLAPFLRLARSLSAGFQYCVRAKDP